MEKWIEIDRNCPNRPWLMHQINASWELHFDNFGHRISSSKVSDHQVSLKLPNSSRRDFRAEAHDLQSQGGRRVKGNRSAVVFHPGIPNSLGFLLVYLVYLVFRGAEVKPWVATDAHHGRAGPGSVESSFQPGLEASVQRSQRGAALQVLGEKLPWPSLPGDLRSKKGDGKAPAWRDVKAPAWGMAMQCSYWMVLLWLRNVLVGCLSHAFFGQIL